MGPTMFDRGTLPVLEEWFHFAAARHRAIANNIANVETPFYKTLDVPEDRFRKAMDRALEEQKRSPVGAFERPALSLEFVEGEGGILRHSENNVDIDVEMGKLVKNASLHNLLTSLLTQQYEMLREAIMEKVT